MIARLRTLALLPVVVLTAGGCLATRGDIEKLQLSLRASADSARIREARSDSATRAMIADATQLLSRQFTRDFNAVSDSVRAVAAGLQRLNGDVALSMHDLRNQLTVVQEGIGQSQRRINDLRTQVEATAQAPVVRPADPAAPPVAGGTPSAPGAPPAATLFQSGKQSLLSNATAAARGSFQTLVDNYPGHDLAAEAYVNVGMSFAQEGNKTAADSVYALVPTKYPASAMAPNAVYKRAMLAIEVKDNARGRALLQSIIDKYPKSDEAVVAQDLLKNLKP